MSQQSALERLSEDSIVIAFDYGLKRIGVAVGNLLTKSAVPIYVYEDANHSLEKE